MVRHSFCDLMNAAYDTKSKLPNSLSAIAVPESI
jgi:hypothetical protein